MGAQRQAVGRDLRTIGHAHTRTGAAVDGVEARQSHVLLQIHVDLRSQHHIACDLHRAGHINAGGEIQAVGAHDGHAEVAREAVAGREQEVPLPRDGAGRGQLNVLDVHRQAGGAQVHVLHQQTV